MSSDNQSLSSNDGPSSQQQQQFQQQQPSTSIPYPSNIVARAGGISHNVSLASVAPSAPRTVVVSTPNAPAAPAPTGTPRATLPPLQHHQHLPVTGNGSSNSNGSSTAGPMGMHPPTTHYTHAPPAAPRPVLATAATTQHVVQQQQNEQQQLLQQQQQILQQQAAPRLSQPLQYQQALQQQLARQAQQHTYPKYVQQQQQQQQGMVAQQQANPAAAAQVWRGVPNPLQQAAAAAAAAAQQQQQRLAITTTAALPSAKPKVVLSPEARQALAKAIWSAIRSPTGTVDPAAMEQAVQSGLPRHAILNAARVAREREALKRKQQQQQQLTASSKMAQQQRPPVVTPSVATTPKVVQQPQAPSVPTSSSAKTSSSATSTSSSSQKQQLQQQAAQLAQQRKLDERNQWKRVHSGVFYVQKGRYLGLPHSIAAIVRAPLPVLPSQQALLSLPIVNELKMIQQQERQLLLERSPPKDAIVELKNPETMKRIKMEPKRVSKALERATKKARQATQESLLKKLKDLNKSIVQHSSDFFKYHRSVKSEASKLAKTVRDRISKQALSEEKKTDQAERARIAALKANDMEAYKSLLANTKDERLQYLWKKTDECLDQISTQLQKRQKNTDTEDAIEEAKSYYASAHIDEEEVRQPSILVGGELKEYQLAGLQWLVSLYNNKLNGILADEMGLGKTIQAISLIAYLMEFKENLGPYLVIVPLSTLSNWVNEFAKWCPAARVIVYKGTPTQRREMYKNDVRNGQFNVLLTTYEYIIKDKGSLKKVIWQYAIVDEGHRMKNAQSKFAVTLGTVYTTMNRILLTGTPLQNNLPELWALLNFLLPTIFSSVESFDQWFNRPFASFSNAVAKEEDQHDQMLSNEERMLIIHRLHELLRPFMLRRVKSEVLDQLPEKVEKVLRCELSSWQKELYKQISYKATVDNKLDSFVQQANPNSRGLNNVVMQLRKVCNHPYLFSHQGYVLNDDLIRSSGKFQLLDDMLPKLKAAGHRVLMFTQMTAVMTILEDYFRYRGYTSLRLDGSTPADERERRMYKFNAPDSPYFIFLLSTRAGGLGLNLATADVVVIFDSDWNPMMDLQAQDRAHRIGQRSDVSVFRLITYSPVEEKILARANEKLNMSELVVEAGKFTQDSVENDNSMERKKMMEVLLTDFDSSKDKTQEKSQEKLERASSDGEEDDDDKDSTASSDDINELLSNNEQDYEIYAQMDEKQAAAPRPALFTNPDDVPDWIKYPSGSKEAAAPAFDPDAGRKRSTVAYDDGLTEKQFLRLMEKQAQDDELSARKRKTSNQADRLEAAEAAASNGAPASGKPEGMTEWTFRKLINMSKSVIALKDPATKRRLSDIFLEKPDANVYPDYYKVIERPIAINDILRKCRGHLYTSIPEYSEDWTLLFANAIKFNGAASWVANDAEALKKELDRVMKKSGLDEATPPPPKRKKLRIKLSLKSVGKADANGGADKPLKQPGKKRRKSSSPSQG